MHALHIVALVLTTVDSNAVHVHPCVLPVVKRLVILTAQHIVNTRVPILACHHAQKHVAGVPICATLV